MLWERPGWRNVAALAGVLSRGVMGGGLDPGLGLRGRCGGELAGKGCSPVGPVCQPRWGGTGVCGKES